MPIFGYFYKKAFFVVPHRGNIQDLRGKEYHTCNALHTKLRGGLSNTPAFYPELARFECCHNGDSTEFHILLTVHHAMILGK